MTATSLVSNEPLSPAASSRRGAIAIAAILAALVVVPYLIGDQFVYHVFITICIFAALSTAWNIVGGFAGQLSLGHAIFYGIGAYAGIILMNMGISPWLGMFVGAAIAVIVALAISYPCFRLHGSFFSLATIAFLEVFRVLALHFRELTGGATGKMIALKFGWEWMVFREKLPPLIIAFGLLLLTLAVAWWIRSHRIGFYLVATREREGCRREYRQSPFDCGRGFGRSDGVRRHLPCDVPDLHRTGCDVLAGTVDPDCNVRADRRPGNGFRSAARRDHAGANL
jgi:branched-chain amino acid transport system permease protein